MRLFTLGCSIAFCATLFGQQTAGSSDVTLSAAGGDPGFTEALFDPATLSDLLKSEEAMGIRFYNVLAEPKAANGTVMAIAIGPDGGELNHGNSYRLSLGFVSGKITMRDLNIKNAKVTCENMDAPEHPSYSASFTKAEVQALLDLTGCQALQAVPATTAKKENTMRLIAMKVADGKATPLGSDPKFEKVCGFPCPTVCGPTKNYLYRTKY